jgi:prefoldin subunit 5
MRNTSEEFTQQLPTWVDQAIGKVGRDDVLNDTGQSLVRRKIDKVNRSDERCIIDFLDLPPEWRPTNKINTCAVEMHHPMVRNLCGTDNPVLFPGGGVVDSAHIDPNTRKCNLTFTSLAQEEQVRSFQDMVDLDALLASRGALEEQIESLRAELDRLRAKRDDLLNRLRDLRDSVVEAREEIRALENEIDELEKKIAELRKKEKRVKAELGELRRKAIRMRCSIVWNGTYNDTVPGFMGEATQTYNELRRASIPVRKVSNHDSSDRDVFLMVPENERRTPYPGPSAELRDKVRSGVFVYVHSDARLKCRTFLNGFGASVPGGYSWGTYATVSVNTNPIVRQSRLRFQNGTYPIKRAHLPSSAVVLCTHGSDVYMAYWPYGKGFVLFDAYDMFNPPSNVRRNVYEDIWDFLKSRSASASDMPVPGGSWSRSCSGEEVKGDTLTARCRDRAGRWSSTSSTIGPDTTCSNIDGSLRCSS